MPGKELFRSLLAQRRETARFSPIDSSTWLSNGSIERYNATFKSVLNNQSIGQVMQEFRVVGKEFFILDLMGYGELFTDSYRLRKSFPFDGALAVALTDPRSHLLRFLHTINNIHLKPGDILKKRTWNQISGWLKQQEQPHLFSAVFCRPGAGWAAIPADFNIYYFLLQQIWDKLNCPGIALIDLPSDINCETVSNWVGLTKQTSGIDALYLPNRPFLSGGQLKVTKTDNSLQVLPTLAELPPHRRKSLFDLELVRA